MHTLQINNDIYHLPESWDELTLQQLYFLVAITRQDTPIEQVKIKMLLRCLNAYVLPPCKVDDRQTRIRFGNRLFGKSYLFTPEEIHSLADLFGFLFEKEEESDCYRIQPKLSVNPFPTLRIQCRRFIGADDGLYDITFEQFIYIQTYLDALQNDLTKLDPLLACIWHRGKRFDIDRLERDAQLLHHLPDPKKMVMLWFITGSLASLNENYPRVFSGGDGVSHNSVFDSQLRLLDSLAGSDMTKKDAVRKGLLIDALYTMDESIRRKEEREKIR